MKNWMIIFLAVVVLALPFSAVASITIKLRGDTAANWTIANPTLADREAGVETDTRKLKIGDGVTAWNSLPYVLAGSSALPYWIDLDTGYSFAIGDLAFYNATLWVATADHSKAVDNYPQDPSEYWAEFSGGGAVDLTAPGPIGTVTPDAGNFTVLTASSIDSGAPAPGETGEIGLLENPDNGTYRVTLKAPDSLDADLVFTLPDAYGTNNQSLITDHLGNLSFRTHLAVDNDLSELMDPIKAAAARSHLGLGKAIPLDAPTTPDDPCLAGYWAFGPPDTAEHTGTLSASAAIDNADGTVGIPIVAHGYEAGEVVTIAGTINYNGAYTLPDQTSGGVDVMVITATYVAETFAGTETTTATRNSNQGHLYFCTSGNTWGRITMESWGD
jgi:hypothetical protein